MQPWDNICAGPRFFHPVRMGWWEKGVTALGLVTCEHSTTSGTSKGQWANISHTDARKSNSDLTRRHRRVCTHICTHSTSKKRSVSRATWPVCVWACKARPTKPQVQSRGWDPSTPNLTKLSTHPHPTPLCLKFDRLEIHLSNMSPLFKSSTPGRVNQIFVNPAYTSVT